MKNDPEFLYVVVLVLLTDLLTGRLARIMVYSVS